MGHTLRITPMAYKPLFNPQRRGFAARSAAFFLILALVLPSPAAASPELSRRTLRAAGLEESNPEVKQGFVSRLTASPAAGLEERVIEKEKGIDPQLLEGIVKAKKTIAIYGGLGSLGERFLQPGFSELEDVFDVEFIAVDQYPRDSREFTTRFPELAAELLADAAFKTRHSELNEGNLAQLFIEDRMRAVGLPYIAYFENSDARQEFDRAVSGTGQVDIGGRSVRVDGVIAAVPTVHHLAVAEPWLRRGVPVWIEKPIAMIPEIDRLRQLADDHPGKVFGVDFFMDSDALNWLLRNPEILGRLGRIRQIDGRCCENWGLEKETRRWLTVPEISGGGLGYDMILPPLAMMEMVLETMGLSLRDAHVTDAFLGRYVDPATGREAPGKAETYLWLKAQAGDVELRVDSGKGIDTVYYGFTITGEKGKIEVMIGTEEYDPYIRVTLNDGTQELYTFKEGGLGYGRTFLNYLLLLHGSNHQSGADLKTRLTATTSSAELVGKAYRFAHEHGKEIAKHPLGIAPSVPEAVDGRIPASMRSTKQRAMWATTPTQASLAGLEEGSSVNDVLKDLRNNLITAFQASDWAKMHRLLGQIPLVVEQDRTPDVEVQLQNIEGLRVLYLTQPHLLNLTPSHERTQHFQEALALIPPLLKKNSLVEVGVRDYMRKALIYVVGDLVDNGRLNETQAKQIVLDPELQIPEGSVWMTLLGLSLSELRRIEQPKMEEIASTSDPIVRSHLAQVLAYFTLSASLGFDDPHLWINSDWERTRLTYFSELLISSFSEGIKETHPMPTEETLTSVLSVIRAVGPVHQGLASEMGKEVPDPAAVLNLAAVGARMLESAMEWVGLRKTAANMQQIGNTYAAELLQDHPAHSFWRLDIFTDLTAGLEEAGVRVVNEVNGTGLVIPRRGLSADWYTAWDGVEVPSSLLGILDPERERIIAPHADISTQTTVFVQWGVLSGRVVDALEAAGARVEQFDLENVPAADPERENVYLLDVPIGSERREWVLDSNAIVINFRSSNADNRPGSPEELGALINVAREADGRILRVGQIYRSDLHNDIIAIDTQL